MASDIAVAFIGGGAGLLTGAVTGTISSLIAPWANWGIEKKRRVQDLRQKRVDEWRRHLDDLDWSENYHGHVVTPGEAPISGDVRTQDWFITLRAEMKRMLSSKCKRRVRRQYIHGGARCRSSSARRSAESSARSGS